MGDYLSKPVTEKHSESGKNGTLAYGASSMQGWRTSQEDAHNAILDYDNGISFFAVYDGHGDSSVSKYCSLYLPEFIKENPLYQQKEYSQALINAFLDFDDTLLQPEVVLKLSKLASNWDVKDETDDSELMEQLQKVLTRGNGTCWETRIPFTRSAKRNRIIKISEVEDGCCSSKDAAEQDEDQNNSNIIIESAESAEDSLDGIEKCVEENAAEEVSQETAKKPAGLTNGKMCVQIEENKVSEADEEENVVVPDIIEEPAEGDNSMMEGTSSVDDSAMLSTNDIWSKFKLRLISAETDDNSEESDESDSSFEPEGGNNNNNDDDDDSVEVDIAKDAEIEDSADEEEEESSIAEDDSESDEEITSNSVKQLLKRCDEIEDLPGSNSGCTACVALVTADQIYVANAGDSRCVVSRAGEAIELSHDHKPEDTIEMDRILTAGGYIHGGRVNGGLNLSRAIGDHRYKRNKDLPNKEQMITALPDVTTCPITPDLEFMVVACDGIWNSMNSQQVVDYIRPKLEVGQSLTSICEQLFDDILAPNTLGEGEGCDNMTCIIIKFLNAAPIKHNKRALSPDEELKAAIESVKKPKGNEGEQPNVELDISDNNVPA